MANASTDNWFLITQAPSGTGKETSGPLLFWTRANFALLSAWQLAQGLNPSTTLWYWNGAAWSFYSTHKTGDPRPPV